MERAGEVVGKEELLAQVWPNVFVDDSNLKTQVSALRRVLGEPGLGRPYVVTVPGRGYNFVASVAFVDGPAPSESGPRRTGWLNHLGEEAEHDAGTPVLSRPERIRVVVPCK